MTEIALDQIPGPLADMAYKVARGGITYLTDHGQRVAAVVPVPMAEHFDDDQAWFWTQEWQVGEREATADREAGRSNVYYSGEEFIAALEADR